MTTPVGSIKLNLEIDGSGLSREILAEVRTALEPTLAQLRRDLNQIEREWGQVGRDAEKSGAKQTAAAKGVASAVDHLGDEYTKAAAKAQAGERISVRSLNAQTRAINKQADAWLRLAAAQTTAAAAPTPDGPSGGGGGGGRGGSSRGGGRGGGRGGLVGFLTGPVGLNAIALGASALPAATTAVVNLTGAVQALGQAGLVIPGVFATIGASFGTAKIATLGMSDAIKAYTDALKSGDPKDMEKFVETTKDMAPAAVAVSKAVGDLAHGPLKDLQKQVAQTTFEGADKTLNDFAAKTIPTATKGMTGIASAWNNTIKELGRVGGLDSTQSFLDKIFGNTAEAQNRSNKAIAPLVHAFGTLTAEGSDFVPRLADGLTKLSTRFDDFISKAAATGDLDKWIDEGFKAADNLGTALLNVGKIITDITGAAGGDGGFLKWLADATGRLHDFLSSTEGQQKLGDFFAEGKKKLDEWLPVLKNVGVIALDVVHGFQQWGDVLLPVIAKLSDALIGLGGDSGLISGVVTAFLAWKSITGIAGLLGDLGKVNTALNDVGGNATKAGRGLKGGLSGLGQLGVTALLGGAISGNTGSGPSAGSVLSALGGGTLLGAEVGGPVGAAVGALAGAVSQLYPLIKQGFDDEAKLKDLLAKGTGTGPVVPAVTPTKPPVDVAQFPGTAVQPPAPNLGLTNGAAEDLRGILAGGALGGTGGGVVDTGALNGALATTQAQITDITKGLGVVATQITQMPSGEVFIKDGSTPQIIKALTDLGFRVKSLPDGQLVIRVKYIDPLGRLVNPGAGAGVGLTAPTGSRGVGSGGRADGGVFPGYAPGVDSIWAKVSPGEGVLIPEAVRALGGASGVYAINSAFRSGLSRRGYADGGVLPDFTTGVGRGPLPGPAGDTVLGLLMQIRDLLAGKGGSGPLVDTAHAVGSLATSTQGGGSGAAGTKLGPFGTPLKPHNAAYDAAAAAISALGGDPEKFLGADPATYFGAGGAGAGTLPGVGGVGGTVDKSRFASALAAFAQSGSVGDVSGLGLDANDAVIKAITAARNKKKGGLDDPAIADLVNQVLTGGGFTGTLDPTNTPLITALETFSDKLAKGKVAGAPLVPGMPTAALTGSAQAIINLAQSANGGQYAAASDLQAGLADCSGAVSDLVETLTKGAPDSGRLFTTANEASVLQSLGATPGFVPGNLNIGLNAGHTAATLPNGVNFESGGSGGGPRYGGTAKGALDPQFTQVFSLPTDMAGLAPGAAGFPTAPGLPGANIATAGAPVPVFVTNFGGGAPGVPGVPGGPPQLGPDGQPLPGQTGFPGSSIVQAGFGAAGAAGSDVAGSLLDAVLAGTDFKVPNAPNADLEQLIKERNPNALASAFGLHVADFTRQGGGGGDMMTNDGPAFDSKGRMFSDAGALIDRTFSDLSAQLKASLDQQMDVLNQVKDRLGEEALKPIMQSAITAGISEISDKVTSSIGQQLGNTAGPIIAAAVKSAIPTSTGGSPDGGALGGVVSSVGGGLAGSLFASGGALSGGTPGRDSVPILGMPGEHMLTVPDVRAMGGQAGVYAFRAALHRRGGFLPMATGGGVIGNDTVGADFFGVSQIPIIGTIVNLLVRVLLKLIGVEIEVRDTLDEMSDSVRQFRGDFQRFDATGRLMNDNSALLDRSNSSEQAVADERIRILKIVLEAIVKFIIEKILVPIGKAVANAAIQAGAAAAGGAINTTAPGAGGIVSSLISSAGSAGVDIGADLFSEFWAAATPVLIDSAGEGLQSLFPDLMTQLFGGSLLAGLFDPLSGGLGGLLDPLLGIFGGIGGGTSGGIFGGLFSGGLASVMAALLGGLSFDDGGVATGIGLMPKAIIEPERVLSPSQNRAFEQMVAANFGAGSAGDRTVHMGGVHMHGTNLTAQEVADELDRRFARALD